MSVQAMSKVWEMSLNHTSLLVLLAMADHADHDGKNIFPSVPLIAWKTGYSERQISRIIAALTASGILVVDQQRPGSSTIYSLDYSVAKLKARRKPKKDPCQNVTTDISSLPPLTKSHGTPDIAVSDITIQPSLREPSISAGALGSGAKAKKLDPEAKAAQTAAWNSFLLHWSENYQIQFGRAYKFNDSRDGKALRELLSGEPYDKVLSVATRAWARAHVAKRFSYCKSAQTIYGLRDRWNEICNELDQKQVIPFEPAKDQMSAGVHTWQDMLSLCAPKESSGNLAKT